MYKSCLIYFHVIIIFCSLTLFGREVISIHGFPFEILDEIEGNDGNYIVSGVLDLSQGIGSDFLVPLDSIKLHKNRKTVFFPGHIAIPISGDMPVSFESEGLIIDEWGIYLLDSEIELPHYSSESYYISEIQILVNDCDKNLGKRGNTVPITLFEKEYLGSSPRILAGIFSLDILVPWKDSFLNFVTGTSKEMEKPFAISTQPLFTSVNYLEWVVSISELSISSRGIEISDGSIRHPALLHQGLMKIDGGYITNDGQLKIDGFLIDGFLGLEGFKGQTEGVYLDDDFLYIDNLYIENNVSYGRGSIHIKNLKIDSEGNRISSEITPQYGLVIYSRNGHTMEVKSARVKNNALQLYGWIQERTSNRPPIPVEHKGGLLTGINYNFSGFLTFPRWMNRRYSYIYVDDIKIRGNERPYTEDGRFISDCVAIFDMGFLPSINIPLGDLAFNRWKMLKGDINLSVNQEYPWGGDNLTLLIDEIKSKYNDIELKGRLRMNRDFGEQEIQLERISYDSSNRRIRIYNDMHLSNVHLENEATGIAISSNLAFLRPQGIEFTRATILFPESMGGGRLPNFYGRIFGDGTGGFNDIGRYVFLWGLRFNITSLQIEEHKLRLRGLYYLGGHPDWDIRYSSRIEIDQLIFDLQTGAIDFEVKPMEGRPSRLKITPFIEYRITGQSVNESMQIIGEQAQLEFQGIFSGIISTTPYIYDLNKSRPLFEEIQLLEKNTLQLLSDLNCTVTDLKWDENGNVQIYGFLEYVDQEGNERFYNIESYSYDSNEKKEILIISSPTNDFSICNYWMGEYRFLPLDKGTYILTYIEKEDF